MTYIDKTGIIASALSEVIMMRKLAPLFCLLAMTAQAVQLQVAVTPLNHVHSTLLSSSNNKEVVAVVASREFSASLEACSSCRT